METSLLTFETELSEVNRQHSERIAREHVADKIFAVQPHVYLFPPSAAHPLERVFPHPNKFPHFSEL